MKETPPPGGRLDAGLAGRARRPAAVTILAMRVAFGISRHRASDTFERGYFVLKVRRGPG